MKRFDFPIQKVLEYKAHAEDKEKAVLGQMRSHYAMLDCERDKLTVEYGNLKTEYAKLCRAGIVVREMAMIKTYLSELNERMKQLSAEMAKEQDEIDRQIQTIMEISQEKDVMTKLKDRYYAQYRKQQRKEMELFIDDFVANTSHFALRQQN